MPRLEYSISYRKKNGSIQFVIQFKDNLGQWKQKTKQGYPTQKAAKVDALKLVEEMQNKIEYSSDESELTIGYFINEYLEHIEIHKEYNTHINYKQSLSNFSSINHIPIDKLRLIDIQKCVNNIIASGVSYTTIDRRTTTFKCFINWVEYTYNVKVPNVKKLTIPSNKNNNKKEKKALTVLEINEIIEYFKNRTKYSIDYYITVLLAGRLGLRLGEISGITIRDIDLKEKSISINKQFKILKLTKEYGFGDLKSKNSYRTAFFGDTTKKQIIDILSLRGIGPNQRLITSTSTRSLNVNLDRVLKRKFDISIHELRHSYATNLIQRGLDFKTVASLLGDDVDEIIRTYSHVNKDMIDNAKETIHKMESF